MKRIAVTGLPQKPLAAAAAFQAQWLPQVVAELEGGEDALIVLPLADHTHREWRLAIAAGLAREHTPRRVNIVAGDSAVLDAFEAYLAAAPGVTGQYLEGDSHGAGDPAG